MKSILKNKLAILALVFLLGHNLNATNNPLKNNTSEISNTIKQKIKFNNLASTKNEKINVVFTVNDLGQVNLVIANTNNKQLKQSIESQFMTLNLSQLKSNNAYSIVFNFKTI